MAFYIKKTLINLTKYEQSIKSIINCGKKLCMLIFQLQWRTRWSLGK